MRLSRFHVEAPSERSGTRLRSSKISALKFINEEDVAFLLAGSCEIDRFSLMRITSLTPHS